MTDIDAIIAMMNKPFDVYVDQAFGSVGPFGTALTFLRSPSKPPQAGTMPQSTEVGVVRMSVEHLKILIYMLKKQIEDAESQLGVSFPVSFRVLNEMKIGPEDWGKFWTKVE